MGPSTQVSILPPSRCQSGGKAHIISHPLIWQEELYTMAAWPVSEASIYPQEGPIEVIEMWSPCCSQMCLPALALANLPCLDCVRTGNEDLMRIHLPYHIQVKDNSDQPVGGENKSPGIGCTTEMEIWWCRELLKEAHLGVTTYQLIVSNFKLRRLAVLPSSPCRKQARSHHLSADFTPYSASIYTFWCDLIRYKGRTVHWAS